MKISYHDIDVTARTVWGEARGEGILGMIAVANVIRNRAAQGAWRRQFGIGTPASACQAPYQFSCWNENDPNRSNLFDIDLNDPTFQLCWYATLGVLLAEEPDNTGGALFYYADTIAPPSWAIGKPFIQIGHHRFIKDA